jgi:hypothetical protein
MSEGYEDSIFFSEYIFYPFMFLLSLLDKENIFLFFFSLAQEKLCRRTFKTDYVEEEMETVEGEKLRNLKL